MTRGARHACSAAPGDGSYDHAVQTWRIVEPVLRAWRDDAVPLQDREAGSDSPARPG